MKKVVILILLLLISLVWLFSAEAEKSVPLKTKPALLVIDIQNEYLPRMDQKDVKLGMEMINYFIALFRAYGFPVIRVYHTDLKSGPKPESEEFQFPKTVAIRDDDVKIVKNYGNAFKKTELDKILKAKGCNTLFLCGLSAVGCVLATYHGAMCHGYDVFIRKGALISHYAVLPKAVQEICMIIDYYPLKLLLENIGN